MMVGMLLTFKGSILDAVMIDLLNILQTELGGDFFDISFLSELVSLLDKGTKELNKPEYSKSLQDILSSNVNNIAENSLKSKMKQILQGINQLDAIKNIDADNLPTQKLDPSAVSQSSKVDIIGASNKIQIPGLDGVDDMVFDKNSVRTKDQSIKIELTPQNGVVADIALQANEQVVGHAKAFGTLNNMDVTREINPFSFVVLALDKLPPLLVISSVVSQMLVQMGRLVEDANLFKVAIVTDNVAALLEIDPLDYIRKIQVSDDSHYAIYEEYKRLYEEVYHFIISLHLIITPLNACPID